MKVDLEKNGDLILVPESEFESNFLENFEIGTVFKKCGLSPSQFLGIKIKNKNNEKTYENKCVTIGCDVRDYYRWKNINLNDTSMECFTEYQKSKI